jgi:hypothetical protein
MHKRDIHFVENITGLGSNPKGTEMDREETDPQTDPNIRFRAVLRGWSNNSRQVRTLLVLSDDKMTKTLRNKQDIILIPRQWWSDAQNVDRAKRDLGF